MNLIEKDENQADQNPLESKSPDGKWIAYTKDFNLFIKSTDEKNVHQLSFEGKENYEYGSYIGWFDKMEGENGIRPERFRVSWSPDSKYLSTYICDLRNADKMYMLDFSIDTMYRPKLLSYYRGSPGDTTMVMMEPVIFDIESKSQIKIDLPRNTHINSASVRWTEQSGKAIVSYPERGFQTQHVMMLDVKEKVLELLIKEESKTNIDQFRFWYLEYHNKILFLSQRSGWRQLYAHDIKSNETKAITQGNYVINDIVYMSDDESTFHILASGVDEEMNPYHQQVYKVSLTGESKLLTPEKLHHRISFSDDGKYFADNMSTINIPTRTVLRSSENGEILAELTKADVEQMHEKGWTMPMIFNTIGKDGKSKIYGAVWRPTNFDPTKKYPIIDHSYTGPHTQVFPKSFDAAFNNQALAELGFVVVMVDGLGTTGRSKEFQNHSYKNMGNNLEDHVRAIKSLAKSNSWIDIEKVGIFGHSAGGYDAGHAMLAFPDFYKVSVASSADHDFRMEKAWWPEMYMGWPVDSTYHEVSNVTMAPNLKGKLLLVHGSIDDNVNASATFKLAEALVKADKEFDLLILPSQRHGYQGDYRKYFIKKRWNYFVKHLKGEEGIWDFEW